MSGRNGPVVCRRGFISSAVGAAAYAAMPSWAGYIAVPGYYSRCLDSVAGQIADGYAITPLIQGKRTGLGFAGVIFSFLFWSAVFKSLLGLLLAIPLSAFCLVLWRTVKERYIKGVI